MSFDRHPQTVQDPNAAGGRGRWVVSSTGSPGSAGSAGSVPAGGSSEPARFGDITPGPLQTPIDDGRWVGPPPRRRRRWRRVIGLTMVFLLLLGAVAVGVGGWWARDRLERIDRIAVAGLGPSTGSATNWLLVGTDSRAGIDPSDPGAGAFLGEEVVGTRTDTIMVARMDPTAGTIDLLSIPRDLWVPIVGRGDSGRINGAFNGEGGQDRLVATVESALAIDLHRYVEVDFVGFEGMIDSLGGVPIWFEAPTRDQGSGLDIVERGCHVLDGSQALAFARGRTTQTLTADGWRTDPTGDIGRTARQREVMARLVGVGSAIGPTDLGTIDRVSAQATDSLTLGGDVGIGEMLGLARLVRAVGAGGIVSHSLPVRNVTTSGGAQVLELLDGEADTVLDRFRGAGGVPAPTGPAAGEAPVDPGAGAAEAPAEGAAQDAAAEDAGADGAPPAEATGGEQAVEEPVIVGAPGYGRYGFHPGPDPASTPCGATGA